MIIGKRVIAAFVLAVGCMVALLTVVPEKIAGMITHFDPYRFETVLDYDSMRREYGIYDKSSPADYGFPAFVEVNFQSLNDSIKLGGWFIHSAPQSKACIILIHGRTSNRLKPMKYLHLIREGGLDTLYNIFIPDMRNSGKADAAETYMGYKFAEDALSAILFAHQRYGQEVFVPFSFSMGAMATFNIIGRDDLRLRLEEKGIIIDKIIVDSPLSNVRETLSKSARDMKLPAFIFNRAYAIFNRQINGFADSMSMHTLLSKNYNTPILVIQSRSDETTPYSILEEELLLLDDHDNIESWIMEGPGHVKIYQDSAFMNDYIQKVLEFMK
ncbi:MAG: hypothetical protein JJU28_17390 [Cyclobacteriaceae bacterium]|nr:hypothetical protein [Cyclobacteriaceae bacterium]